MNHTLYSFGLLATALAISLFPISCGDEKQAHTLLGKDANDNGVRDDVDDYIHDRFSDQNTLKAAAVAYARSLQKTLAVAENAHESIALAKQDGIFMACLAYLRQDEYADITRDLEAITYNTKLRRQVYLKHNSHLGGQVFSLSPSTKESCAKAGVFTQK